MKAHIYNVVQLTDGTRFLDVCSPRTADDDCRFTFVSFAADRKEVGDLQQYAGKDVQVRGKIRIAGGRSEIVVSEARQFRGGAEKFRPNPDLVKGFSAEDGKPPVNDPAFRVAHHHRTSASSQ